MKINYDRIKELNIESLTSDGNQQLSCFYIIQNGVERHLSGEVLSEDYKSFLIGIGVFIEEELLGERKEIVKPFNFMGDGTQSN